MIFSALRAKVDRGAKIESQSDRYQLPFVNSTSATLKSRGIIRRMLRCYQTQSLQHVSCGWELIEHHQIV